MRILVRFRCVHTIGDRPLCLYPEPEDGQGKNLDFFVRGFPPPKEQPYQVCNNLCLPLLNRHGKDLFVSVQLGSNLYSTKFIEVFQHGTAVNIRACSRVDRFSAYTSNGKEKFHYFIYVKNGYLQFKREIVWQSRVIVRVNDRYSMC